MKICPTCQTEYADDVEFCSADGMKLRRVREVSEDPMIGRALDRRWIIESKLGEGGMGAVYAGRQKSVNRKVAIKTLRPQLADNDEFVDRFFREAKVATTINHPHCVTILDFGQDDDETLYLAMEYLEGEALADRMARGAMPLQDILRVGVQVTSALAAAHSHQIIHRDLKPDNIYLLDIPGGGVFAKVLDFGIAKVNTEGATQYTRTGQVFGTPDYMSPEQCSGYELDGRSDLYALGCILYEMVLGKTPFTTPSSNSMAILMAHIHEVPATPSAQGVTLPAEVESIIMRLLHKDPNVRAESASALNRELEALLAGLEGDMVPSLSGPMAAAATAFDATAAHVTPGPMPSPRPPTASTSPQFAPAAPQPKRSVVPLVAVGILVALAIAGASAFALSLARQDDPNAATAAATTTQDDDSSGEVAAKEDTPPEATEPEDEPATEPNVGEDEGTPEPTTDPAPEDDTKTAAAEPEDEPKDAPKPTRKTSKPKTTKKTASATKRTPADAVEDVHRSIDMFQRDTKKIARDIEQSTTAVDVLLNSGKVKTPKRKKTRKNTKKKQTDAMDALGF